MEQLLTALIPLTAVAVIVILARRIGSHRFQCKHCSQEFSIPWPKVLITAHTGNEYLLVCPVCKVKGWCTALPKEPPAK